MELIEIQHPEKEEAMQKNLSKGLLRQQARTILINSIKAHQKGVAYVGFDMYSIKDLKAMAHPYDREYVTNLLRKGGSV